MVSVLFWNVNKRADLQLIRRICDEHRVDILALAEFDKTAEELLLELNRSASQQFSLVKGLTRRVKMFSRLPDSSVRPISDDGEVCIRSVKPPVGMEIILAAVHLRSKLHMKDKSQTANAARRMRVIELAEKQLGHSRTVLIGDFNMNPFEDGIVGADSFHAVMDKRLAKENKRKVDGQDKQYFYNPMWSFFGNGELGPPGTFFRKDSDHFCFFWNMFDQVLLRPDIIDRVTESGVKIVSKIGDLNLLNARGRINTQISDHLPIALSINLEGAS